MVGVMPCIEKVVKKVLLIVFQKLYVQHLLFNSSYTFQLHNAQVLILFYKYN